MYACDLFVWFQSTTFINLLIFEPSATGRILADGTYEVIIGDLSAIRRKPIDEFDRRMFLLGLRDIDLVEPPAKRPFLCQT